MSNQPAGKTDTRDLPCVLVIMQGDGGEPSVADSLRAARRSCEGIASCHALVILGAPSSLRDDLCTPEFSSWVRLLAGERGESPARARNRGLEWAAAWDHPTDYFLFLTPGIEVGPTTLAAYLMVCAMHPEIGAVSGPLQDSTGLQVPAAFRFPSLRAPSTAESPWGAFESPWPPPTDPANPFPVDWVLGFSLLARRQVINAVGGFDTALATPYDTMDFLARAGAAGFSCWYDPAAPVRVVGTLATHGVSPTQRLDSRRGYWLKHLGRERAMLADSAWLASRALSLATAQAGSNPTSMGEFVRHSALLPRNRAAIAGHLPPLRRFDQREKRDTVPRVGLVAIGRNEGDRLRHCLESAGRQVQRLVYVDSGSTDGSVDLAKSLGAEVVDLDMSQRFTAARARNAGYARLLEVEPDLDFVHFVDGDCELSPGWVERALAFAVDHPTAAVVAGRRRERFPEASVYNRLCDREWNTPVGQADAVGGDALIRVSALREVGGYDPSLIAGEEPEMCARLRLRGWEIWRIEGDMTIHDAAIFRAKQWWQRTRRAGHAYAEVSYRYRTGPLRVWAREVRSICFWGNPLTWPAWPILWWRLFRRDKDLAYATTITIGKVPQFLGLLEFHYNRLSGKQRSLIEYK